MKELDETEYKRLTTEEFKACKGCKHRVKEQHGTISEQADEATGCVYGCGLGQTDLKKEVSYLPEQCKARNIACNSANRWVGLVNIEKKERDNCSICMVYKDQKPVCKTKGIRMHYCPCKACPDFMRTEYGCVNFTKTCQEKFKYEVIKEEAV